MHKPVLLVFSLLLSSSVCVGMEGFPQHTPQPSVLGFNQTAQPQRLADSPKVRQRIRARRKAILDLIAKIRDGYSLPEVVKGAELRRAQAYGLREELEKAIADQKNLNRKRRHTI